ncbi:MAG: hypothetical protein ACM31D_15175 [Bacteroidota bacterium]
MNDDRPRRIADSPHFAELDAMAKGLEAVSRVLPLLSFFRLFKGDMAEVRAQLDDISAQRDDILYLPDRFNDHFADRGWIAHETMNLELMRRSVDLADQGQIEKAEAELVAHYDEGTLDFWLRSLRSIPCFEPRLELLELAKADYLAGRYHASVPVVLAMIDGAANDLGHVGFFAEGAQLEAPNSIAGHVSGITRLAKAFGKTRRKTSTDLIPVPYRNGILHGVDLGYAQKDIAAKCWAALFAVGDWARALTEPEKPKKKKTFFETIQQIAATAGLKRSLAEWRPREGVIPQGKPLSASADCEPTTPERAAAEFLEAWRMRNFGKMAATLDRRGGRSTKAAAGDIRKDYTGYDLHAFRLTAVRDDAAAISIVDVDADVRTGTGILTTSFELRMICKDQKGSPTVRGQAGQWLIVHDPIWTIRGHIFRAAFDESNEG